MTPAERTILGALRQSRWCVTDAAKILEVPLTSVQSRIYRSDALKAAWRKHAQRRTDTRGGRPPKHASLTLAVVAAAFSRRRTIADAARELGLSYNGAYSWALRHPELRTVPGTAAEVSP